MSTPVSRYPGELEEKVEPSITCPRCGATSYNVNDIEQKYCGRCHLFLEDVVPYVDAFEVGGRTAEDLDLARQLGFCYVRTLPDNRFLGVEPTLHGGAMLKLSTDRDPRGECDDVWQYQELAFAVHAAATWNPANLPEPIGWYRHPDTGRRRPYGNPKNEYVRE